MMLCSVIKWQRKPVLTHDAIQLFIGYKYDYDFDWNHQQPMLPSMPRPCRVQFKKIIIYYGDQGDLPRFIVNKWHTRFTPQQTLLISSNISIHTGFPQSFSHVNCSSAFVKNSTVNKYAFLMHGAIYSPKFIHTNFRTTSLT